MIKGFYLLLLCVQNYKTQKILIGNFFSYVVLFCLATIVGCGNDKSNSTSYEMDLVDSSDDSCYDCPNSSSSFLELKQKSSDSKMKSSSSEIFINEWSWDISKVSLLSQNANYGVMIDSRDGKEYKKVTIGIQTWMAENLNYYNDKDNKLKERSWCYENVNENCNVAGRLYAWTTAVGKTEKECGDAEECDLGDGDIQGVCPIGWHLPKYEEWMRLISYVGEKKVNNRLRTQLGWTNNVRSTDYIRGYNGSDFYGFSAMPAGERGRDGDYYSAGYSSHFWSSTCSYSFSSFGNYPEAFSMDLFYRDGEKTTSSDLLHSHSRADGYSIRCLQNFGSVDSVDNNDVYGWSWGVSKKARQNSDVVYEEMTDIRDGKKYKYVTIGTQRWMAENLNYYDENLEWESWCYEDEPALCTIAGRLYTWSAAIRTDEEDCGYGENCNLSEKNVRGICPPGWHLPTKEEWSILMSNVGEWNNAGKMLKSKTGWIRNSNGNDNYGFTALPVGFKDLDRFDLVGSHALFWSATEINGDNANSMNFSYFGDIATLDAKNKDFGLSVRCLQD